MIDEFKNTNNINNKKRNTTQLKYKVKLENEIHYEIINKKK